MSKTIDVKPIDVSIASEEEKQSVVAYNEAVSIEIKDQAIYEKAGELRSRIRSRLKWFEDARKSITQPLDQAKKAVMDLFRSPTQRYEQALEAIDRAMIRYDDDQEKKRKAEEDRLAREAEKAYNETVLLTNLFTNKLVPLMKTAGAQAGLAFKQGLVNAMSTGLMIPGISTTQGGFRHNRGGYSGGVSSFAYGTDQIVSSPTPFIAGEGYSPERVIVQPLSPIGGNIGVSWQGNGIPINVNGASGLDAGQIGAAINTALQGFAMEYVRQRSGSRGQRGR